MFGRLAGSIDPIDGLPGPGPEAGAGLETPAPLSLTLSCGGEDVGTGDALPSFASLPSFLFPKRKLILKP